jgi:hypothetical protein
MEIKICLSLKNLKIIEASATVGIEEFVKELK